MAINESQLALLKIQLKRATSSQWNQTTDTGGAWNGYVLRQAELGIEVFPDNTTKIKIGNGTSKWSELPYVAGESGFFVDSLPAANKAIKNNFYILGDKIYYTSNNNTWTLIGDTSSIDFNTLLNRPKYNGSVMKGSTDIPKVPTEASELDYVNGSSGLTTTNVQSAIDEIALKMKSLYTRPTGNSILFGNNSAGVATTFPYSTSKTASTIAQRTTTGTLKAVDPIENDDLATKLYVDDLVNPLTTRVTSLESNVSSYNTKIKNLETRTTNIESDVTTLKNKVDTIEPQVETNTDNITSLNSKLGTTNITVANLTNQVNELKESLENIDLDAVEAKITEEATKRQNNDIISIEGGIGASNNQIRLTKGDGSTLTGTIPLATNTSNGLISYTDYKQIIANRDAIQELKNQSGGYIGISFPIKADLDKYQIPATTTKGSSTFVLDDETHNGATTKYYYDGTSFKFAYVIEYDPIGTATTTTKGIVLSSQTDGKVFVETDGTMSLNGYDAIITSLNNKPDRSELGAVTDNNYSDEDKSKVGLIVTDGDGDMFLGDDGQYHTIIIPEGILSDIVVDGNSIIDPLTKEVDLDKIVLTGSYNDLKDKPANLVQDAGYVHTDNNYNNTDKSKVGLIVTDGDGKSVLSNDGTYKKLADVAFNGSYNSLTNIPTNLVQDSNYVHTDNNFTNGYRDKVDQLKLEAEENIIDSISVNNSQLIPDSNKNVNIDLSKYALEEDIPTKTSDLQNDTNFVSDANYIHTDNNFTNTLNTKLEGIESGAQVNILEGVKVDGTLLDIDFDKSVNISLVDYAKKDSVDILEDRILSAEINIQALEAGGLWRGIFDTYASLPKNAISSGSSFVGGTVDSNDYVIIREDETHLDEQGNPCKTRYYATAIADDGAITWTYFDKEEGSIAVATNSSLGLVKGTEYIPLDESTIGKVSVEADGSMSVNGLNNLGYLPLAGSMINTPGYITDRSGPMTGSIWFDNENIGLYGRIGTSDYYRVKQNSGLEIAVGHVDEGDMPIYVRQYEGDGTSVADAEVDNFRVIKRTLTLLDSDGNTVIPGNLKLSMQNANITWEQGAYYQRIATIDNTSVGTDVFRFQQSTNTGSSFTTLASVTDQGKIIATENLKTNNGEVEFIDKVTQRYNSDEECIEFIFA